ncbi:DotA/TraY family protein [Tateyamaria sp.]|uniref:DotA/TraY family protein n=1 Tax=Tateyamaria sp. TaxID=1929288 RepID=UPI00329E064B
MRAETRTSTGILSKDNAQALWRYATRPEILPRFRGLGAHFGHFAYLIALVLNSARLLPQGHYTLNPANIGHFGVRQVLAIAANNITWSMRNIDQIAIFGAVVSGLIMIVIQLVLIAVYAFFGQAEAASTTNFFETPAANVPTDAALIMLEQVFGPNLNFFGTASNPTGTPVYLGLQAVLGFYSLATMVIAVIIVIYYVMTVIGEAAQTGTPFGKRFNSLWAPIRLVIALGLLVPLGSNLNSAQYITLWTAKMGSGLGTQVWSTFVNQFTATSNIVTRPANKSTIQLVRRIFLNEVCAAAYNQSETGSSSQISILQKLGAGSEAANFASVPDMIAVAGIAGETSVSLSWSKNSAGSAADDYTCGKVTVSLSEFDLHTGGTLVNTTNPGFWSWVFGGPNLANKIGELHTGVKAAYIGEIKAISDAVKPAAEAIAKVKISVGAGPEYGDLTTLTFIPALLRQIAEDSNTRVNLEITSTYTDLAGSDYARSTASDDMTKRGWAAAGLWYANIGKINQKFNDAISAAAPTLDTLFSAEEMTQDNRSYWSQIWDNRFGGSAETAAEISTAIIFANDTYGDHIASGVPANSPLYQDARDQAAAENSTNRFSRFIFSVFGATELYDLTHQPDLDPMSRMVSAGHSMVTSSLIAFGIGGASKIASFFVGEDFFNSVAVLAFAIGVVGFVAGVFLAYVLPLLPFVYFSFAVMGWVLEIFEAIVAMPLWALSHLRIDGDGMPGPTAMQGYHLLLMVLIRPAMIVIGLIGGYVIFGAVMYYFISLFGSAVSITRADYIGDSTGFIGVFIYTIIFVFLAYNIALMCFKMIDDVPKGILRWMGSGAQPFSDSRGDPINGSREAVIGTVAGASKLYSGGMRGLTGEGDPTGQSKGAMGAAAGGIKRAVAAKATGGASEVVGGADKMKGIGDAASKLNIQKGGPTSDIPKK